MEKQITKNWIISFFCGVLGVLMSLCVVAYIVDPFFQFRAKDNSYMLSGQFVSAGLVKNYDYDTFIIGSSMTQNFDMDLFREKLDANPLHIGLGRITSNEELELLELAYARENVDRYYICADMYMFTEEPTESKNPQYLLKNDFLSRCRYLLSYEVWARYIPIDIGFMILDHLGVSLPQKYQEAKSIDKLENFSLDYTFSEEIVLSNYAGGAYGVSKVDAENLYETMKEQIDRYVSCLDFEKGEYTFFFPPYSALYWCDTQADGTFEAYMQAKKYFVQKLTECGAMVYDFQSADVIVDLNNYKDITHYSPEINDWMVECFANQECIITVESCDEFQAELERRLEEFRLKYSYLFE